MWQVLLIVSQHPFPPSSFRVGYYYTSKYFSWAHGYPEPWLHFPASLAARHSSHVTKCWPMGCEQKWCVQLLSVSLNEVECPRLCAIPHPFLPARIWTGWLEVEQPSRTMRWIPHFEDSRATKTKGAWASDILPLGLFPTRAKWTLSFYFFFKPLIFIFNFLIFIFWPCLMACGILVPQPEIEPGHQQWKCWALTTRPPANSLNFCLDWFLLFWIFCHSQLNLLLMNKLGKDSCHLFILTSCL